MQCLFRARMDWMDPKAQVALQAHLDKMEAQAPLDPKDHEERVYVHVTCSSSMVDGFV